MQILLILTLFFLRIKSQEVQSKISSLSIGSTNQVELSRALINSMTIPLPSLLEQKRIADKLEQLLERVTQSAARLETALTAVKRFRQSVLAAAVSGKLTEEWRGDESGATQLST
jgi:type I restriction enzyme, S subunit